MIRSYSPQEAGPQPYSYKEMNSANYLSVLESNSSPVDSPDKNTIQGHVGGSVG